jgi:hypothetical protein
MNITIITIINQVITALAELEAKGCHRVWFEYGNGLFRVRICKTEADNERVVYENTVSEQEHADELLNRIKYMKNHVMKTDFRCYRQEFIKGEKSGKWEETRPCFECDTINAYGRFGILH